MGREILYRGKEIKTGKWVYGGFHEHKPSITAIGKQPETEALIIADGDADWDLPVPIKAYAVEKKTVGQYTGLKDNNGANIFEGDIVLRINTESSGITNRIKCLITFEIGCFMISRIEPFPFTQHKWPFHEDYRKLTEFEGYFEIIGNAHDTPELLDREVTP